MWANHCCRTGWPDGFNASSHQARSWTCGSVVAEGVDCATATLVGATPIRAKRQGQPEASSQCALHGLRRGQGREAIFRLASPPASAAACGQAAPLARCSPSRLSLPPADRAASPSGARASSRAGPAALRGRVTAAHGSSGSDQRCIRSFSVGWELYTLEFFFYEQRACDKFRVFLLLRTS